MQTIKGIAVSPGVAIAPAIILDAEEQPIARRQVPVNALPAENQRLDAALDAAKKEIEHLRDQAAKSIGQELARIFSFHIGMLEDEHLLDQLRTVIESEQVTAEYAVYVVLRRMAQTFLQQDSELLRDRVSDVRDLEKRLLRHLLGSTQADLHNLAQQSVVIAHDLTPSQTASFDRSKIRGLATDAGGRTSHTAILAHALGIPAVVGLENITSQVTSGDMVVIDGNRGLVVIDPDADRLMEYRQQLRRMAAMEGRLEELRQLPAVTKDGTEIDLGANIEFPSEIKDAVNRGAEGIGLYRTEFLFLASETVPSEAEQYKTYVEAITALEGRPLCIRTLDLGADKINQNVPVLHEYPERNPFLGCRSIRLCLQNLQLFKTQLRAVLRASAHGPVQLMFPLISNVMELRQARMVLADVMEDLDEQGEAYDGKIPVGIMIEVPSAALQAEAFAREADFFSIGTNDLIQYTVAVDRSNERIANLYSGAHPAVISLIKQVIRAGQRAKIEVSLCGEMAGEPAYTMLLLGLGLRRLSITPPAIPEVKKIIRSVSIDQCRRVARKVAQFDTDRQILNYLRDEVRKVNPEVFEGGSFEF